MCTEVPAKKTNLDRDFFLSWPVGGAVVYGNFAQAPHCKTKKVIVRSGPLSVEVLFLGRDIGQLGQGCPSPPDPQVYRGPCKKNKLRPRFFSQLVGRRGAVVYGNFTQAPPLAGQKKVYRTAVRSLGTSFISLQGHRSVGTPVANLVYVGTR
jgi:hypothetical protein